MRVSIKLRQDLSKKEKDIVKQHKALIKSILDRAEWQDYMGSKYRVNIHGSGSLGVGGEIVDMKTGRKWLFEFDYESNTLSFEYIPSAKPQPIMFGKRITVR